MPEFAHHPPGVTEAQLSILSQHLLPLLLGEEGEGWKYPRTLGKLLGKVDQGWNTEMNVYVDKWWSKTKQGTASLTYWLTKLFVSKSRYFLFTSVSTCFLLWRHSWLTQDPWLRCRRSTYSTRCSWGPLKGWWGGKEVSVVGCVVVHSTAARGDPAVLLLDHTRRPHSRRPTSHRRSETHQTNVKLSWKKSRLTQIT